MINTYKKLYEIFKDAKVEKVCLVDTDGEVYEIPNDTNGQISTVHFEIKNKKAVTLMMKLYAKKKLAAIAHNHPTHPATPSFTDLHGHNRPVLMIIYSNLTESFSVYLPEKINKLKEESDKLREERDRTLAEFRRDTGKQHCLTEEDETNINNLIQRLTIQ